MNVKHKNTYLLPCPDPSICDKLPEADKPWSSSERTAKDAWAQAAAILGPIAEARKATYKVVEQLTTDRTMMQGPVKYSSSS